MATQTVISEIAEVHKFILELRACAGGKLGTNVRLEPRDEVTQGIADIGITKTQARQEVAGLRVRDYCSGPEEDRDENNAPGEVVWLFTKRIMNKTAYIKIKIVNKNCLFVKCLSFHPPKFPMTLAFTSEQVDKFKEELKKKEAKDEQ